MAFHQQTKFLAPLLKCVNKFFGNFQIPIQEFQTNFKLILFNTLSDCLPESAIHYREPGLFSRLSDASNKILYQILFFIYSGIS